MAFEHSFNPRGGNLNKQIFKFPGSKPGERGREGEYDEVSNL